MEDRPGHELEPAVLRPPDLGAGQIGGQQVGCELHPREIRLQPRGQRADRGGLGQPGRALDQQMPVGQQGDQQPFDQRGLAHDALRQRLAQQGELTMQPVLGGRGSGFWGQQRRYVHRPSVTDSNVIGSLRSGKMFSE